VLTSICPNCHSRQTRVFYNVDAVPVNSCLVLRSAEQARAFPVGDIALSFCMHCGFVFNAAFDESLIRYQTGYEESQGYSPTFNRFEQALVEHLVRDYELRDKTVVEIGCGKGEFLIRLCACGDNRGIGYDPTFDPERVRDKIPASVSFVQAFFTQANAVPADVYCCKMTLEHIPDSARFVAMLREAIGSQPDSLVFFQVPDATRIIEQCAFEDIYYEHCAYFTPESLRYLFETNGFEILRLESVYDAQYLTLEARPLAPATAEPVEAGAGGSAPAMPVQTRPAPALTDAVGRFPLVMAARFADWTARLEAWSQRQAKIVIWGGGSKAVAVLATPAFADHIICAVDINPYRQHTLLPVSAIPVVAPEALIDIRPDVVIIANAVYREEISAQLQSLGLNPRLETLDG
jgi:SAM-dependent methyltransferase